MENKKIESGLVCGFIGIVMGFGLMCILWSILDGLTGGWTWRVLCRSGGAIQLASFIIGFIAGFIVGYINTDK